MKALNLTLKKKWFDMILSGEKKEEYREIKPYWEERLCNGISTYFSPNCINGIGYEVIFKKYNLIKFRNGYAKNAPTITVECLGIEIGEAKPNWSDNWKGDVFIIKLGNIVDIINENKK